MECGRSTGDPLRSELAVGRCGMTEGVSSAKPGSGSLFMSLVMGLAAVGGNAEAEGWTEREKLQRFMEQTQHWGQKGDLTSNHGKNPTTLHRCSGALGLTDWSLWGQPYSPFQQGAAVGVPRRGIQRYGGEVVCLLRMRCKPPKEALPGRQLVRMLAQPGGSPSRKEVVSREVGAAWRACVAFLRTARHALSALDADDVLKYA